MHGALAAGAVVLAVAATTTSATAAPPTSTAPVSGTPMQQYQQLSQQEDALNEQINAAKVQLAAMNAKVAQASGDIANAQHAEQIAQGAENQYRGTVDALADASFEGARLNQLSALLTGTSARDFLNRATDLEYIAEDTDNALNRFQGAVNAARAAENRAQQDKQTAQNAANAANALLNQLNAQNQQLTAQLAKVNAALHQLTATEQASLNTNIGPAGSYVAPPGAAGAAMEVALGERGKPYQFGGAGPSVFDCSGLVMWSYAHEGISLPHSAAAQQQLGVPVARANLQPGDLVFFGSPAYHVGIYVGNGMMVDAPAPGQVVQVQAIFSGYSNARRLGG